MKLKKNDLVAVIGSTRSKSGDTEKHRILATVVGVGKKDVFLQTEKRSSIFRMPAERCLKIDDTGIMTSGKITEPKLGDLVLSVVEKFGKIERKMGVLVEIVEIPGRSKTAKILKGETTNIVLLDTLIVLE